MFDGILQHHPDEPVHLDVDKNITPHWCRAYPIPWSQWPKFKTELNRLIKAGVLSPAGCSSWISGTFIIPKKDNTICWVSDFRALHKAIKCNVYPIPRIQDILSHCSGYKFLIKLDISMQYYTRADPSETVRSNLEARILATAWFISSSYIWSNKWNTHLGCIWRISRHEDGVIGGASGSGMGTWVSGDWRKGLGWERGRFKYIGVCLLFGLNWIPLNSSFR